MSPQLLKISCGRWRRCFAEEAGDERDLYSVAAGSKKIQQVAGADYCLHGPAAFVFVGARFRTGSRVSESRRWKLLAVHGAGDCGNVGVIHVGVFWNRAAVGPAVWFLKRDAGCARGAD